MAKCRRDCPGPNRLPRWYLRSRFNSRLAAAFRSSLTLAIRICRTATVVAALEQHRDQGNQGRHPDHQLSTERPAAQRTMRHDSAGGRVPGLRVSAI